MCQSQFCSGLPPHCFPLLHDLTISSPCPISRVLFKAFCGVTFPASDCCCHTHLTRVRDSFSLLVRAPKTAVSTDRGLLQVWKHELFREFSDKLVSQEEQASLFTTFCDACMDKLKYPKPSAPVVAPLPPTSNTTSSGTLGGKEKVSARNTGRESERKRDKSPSSTPRIPANKSSSPRARHLKKAVV